MEILDDIHRIDAEIAGRPLYLFLFLGERNLLLDAGCSTTVEESLLPYLGRPASARGISTSSSSPTPISTTRAARTRSRPRTPTSRSRVVRSTASSSPTRMRSWRADTTHFAPITASATTTRRRQAPPDVRIGAAGRHRVRRRRDDRSRQGRRASRAPRPRALAGPHRRSTTRDPERCSAATASRDPSTSGSTGRAKLCPTYTDVDPYLQTLDLIEALAPSELHGCHWPAARRRGGARRSWTRAAGTPRHLDGLVRACFAEAPDGLTLAELIGACQRAA